jgi:hypothetical protein
MPKYTYDIIREEIVPGSIDDFRTLMHEFLDLQPEFSNDIIYLRGEQTPKEYPINSGRWEYTLGGTLLKRGFVIARQIPGEKTKLQFAYHSKFQKIGLEFEKTIDEILTKCFDNAPEFQIREPSLKQSLKDFGFYIQSQVRMTFWNKEKKNYKWISRPERHAQTLLKTFLNGRFNEEVYTFEEIESGAGFIDLFIITPNGEKAVVELKMCGHRYSLAWAKSGIKQTAHYMRNRRAQEGYLIVFDSRLRDYAEGFQAEEIYEDSLVNTIIIDLRPVIKYEN